MTDYTYNTGNPIGSTDVRDGVDNLKSFDVLLNSTDDAYQDRLGNTVPTAAGAIKRLGPVVTTWTFTTGGTLNYPNEAALNPADGNYYSWGGAYPAGGYVVAPGTNPVVVAGYVPRTDVVLRADLAASAGAEQIGTAEGITLSAKLSKLNASYKKCADYKGRLGYLDGAFGIECWGDSTMWGSISGNAASQEAVSPPVALDLALYSVYRGNNPTVTNMAIPGTSLNSMINGLHLYPHTFDYEMSVSTASIIYCNHAHNDCFSGGSTPAEFKQNLIKFVTICRKYGKVPVLVTPNVVNYTLSGNGVSPIRYGAYVDQIRDVAKALDVDLVDIYKHMEATARSVSMLEIVPDGGHPSTKAYHYIGTTLALPLITPIRLSKEGDGGAITLSTFKDVITTDRQLIDSANPFGKVLSGTIASGVQRINIPVLLESPTDDTFVALGIESSGVGGIAQLLHNDTFRPDFSGIVWYLSTVPTKSYLASSSCDMWAGVSIVGVIASSSLIPGTDGKNFNIAGVKLLQRGEVKIPMPWYGSMPKKDRVIMQGDAICFDAYIDAAAPLQTHLVLSSVVNNTPWLTVKSELGVVKVTLPNSTTIIATVATAGYSCKVELESYSYVKVTIGGVVMQLPQLIEQVPNSYLSSTTQQGSSYYITRG